MLFFPHSAPPLVLTTVVLPTPLPLPLHISPSITALNGLSTQCSVRFVPLYTVQLLMALKFLVRIPKHCRYRE